jgi:DNA-binding response OmpR family regulator
MNGKRILLIDDDPDYVYAVKMILEKANYSVRVSYSPKEGYAALQDGEFDLVIVDVMMGRGAEGIIVARKLKKDRELKKLPLLMITGIREQTGFFFIGDPRHETFLPVDGFLEKPVNTEVLLNKVRELLHSDQTAELKQEKQGEEP